MPASPWRTIGSPDPNGELVALLSFLPLKSYWRVLPFFLYTARVVKQLASAEGLLGYSFLARPRSFSMAELKSFPACQQITHQACEEGWSFIAPWIGVPLAYVLNLRDPSAEHILRIRLSILTVDKRLMSCFTQ